jgi:hypothetical protein
MPKPEDPDLSLTSANEKTTAGGAISACSGPIATFYRSFPKKDAPHMGSAPVGPLF